MADYINDKEGFEPLKGLKGLHGYSDLTEDEKTAWLNAQISAGKLNQYSSDNRKQQLYRNQQFIQRYGLQTFQTLTPEQRDQMLRGDILKEGITEKYAGQEDLSQILSLEPQYQEEYYNTVDSQKAFDEKYLNAKSAVQEQITNPEYMRTLALGKPAQPGADMLWFQKGLNQGSEDALRSKTKDRENTIASIYKKDALLKAEDPEIKAMADKIQLSVLNGEDLTLEDGSKMNIHQAIDKEFNDIMEGSIQKVNSPFGSYDVDHQGSNFYKAYKDDYFKDLTESEKINLISQYKTLKNKYGEGIATQVLETTMENKVYEKQSWFDWMGNSTKQVGIGGIANLAKDVLAYKSMYILTRYGEQGLAKWLQGKDPVTGLPLEHNFDNPWYWDGVEKYNTTDKAEMLRAEQNGGISRYQNVFKPGTETDFFSHRTGFAAYEMNKFMWSQLLMNAGLGAGASGIVKGVGRLSKAVAQGANVVAQVGITINSSLPIAMAYGQTTFSEVLNSNLGNLNAKINQDAFEYADKLSQTEEGKAAIQAVVSQDMINWANTKGIKWDAEGNISEQYKEEAFLQFNYFLQQRTSEFLQAKAQEYENTPNPKYDDARQEAERTAAQAFIMDASLETARMSLTNALWGGWKFGKSTRDFWGGNPYSKQVGLTAENTLTSTVHTGAAKAKQMIKPIWDGFQSNYLDDVTLKTAEGFGLGKYNNYLERQFDPERALNTAELTSDNFAGMWEAMNMGRASLIEKQSFIDGAIGAIGSAAGGSFATRLFGDERITPERYEARYGKGKTSWNKLSLMNKIDKIFRNPIMDSYYTTQEKINTHENNIKTANEVINKNKQALNDIWKVVSGLTTQDEAVKRGSTIDAIDAHLTTAVDLMHMVEQWSKDPILSQSPLVKQVHSDIEGILEGKYSEDKMNELALEYIARHKDLQDKKESGKQQEAIAEAKEGVIKSVKEVVENYNRYKQIYEEAQKKANGDIPGVAEQIAKSTFLLESYEKRLASMTKTLTGSEYMEQYTNYKEINYGSRTAYDRIRKEAIKDKEQTEVNIKSTREKIREIESKLKSKQYKGQQEKQALKAEQSMLQVYLDSQYRVLVDQEFKIEGIEEDKSLFYDENGKEKHYVPNKIFTVEEIKKLTPRERLRMLQHPDDYSKQQQIEINKYLEEILADKTGELRSKILDTKEMVDRIDMINTTRWKLTSASNAEALRNYIIALQIQYDNNAIMAQRHRRMQSVSKQIESATTIEELKSRIFEFNPERGKFGISSMELKEYLKDNADSKYAKVLNNLLEVVQVREDIANAIKELYGTEQDANLAQLLMTECFSLITNTSNAKEAILSIENAIAESNDEINRSYLNKILDKLTEMDYQRQVVKPKEKPITQETKQEEQQTHIQQEEKKETEQEKPKENPEPTEENYTGQAEEVNLGTVDSPSVQEQISQANETQTEGTAEKKEVISTKVVEVQDFKEDAQKNNTVQSETSNDLLFGNMFVEFDNQALVTEGKLVHKEGVQKQDTMDQFYTWLRENNIKMQDIIDNELGQILRANPKTPIKFLFRKPQPSKRNTPTDRIQDLLIMVVENTDDVKRIHKKENGSISTDGKEYIVVGVAGFKLGNTSQQRQYLSMQGVMKQNRKKYFDANPTMEYYVDDTFHTYVHQMTQGWIVNQMPGDVQVTWKPITELADGKVSERNPQGLSLTDLKWGIAKYGEMALVGVNTERNPINNLRDRVSQAGDTFLYIESANGTLIPVKIRPKMYNSSEMMSSELGKKIYAALNQLRDSNLQNRLDARAKLSHWLSFSQEKNGKGENKTILIDGNTIEIKANGHTETFIIDDASFERSQFMQAIDDAHFRINITVEDLRSESRLQELAEAGALDIDIAKLGVANAIYDIFPCDNTGKPVITEGVSWITTPKSERPQFESKKPKSLILNREAYKFSEGQFKDSKGTVVTDAETIKKLEYLKQIQDRNLQSVYYSPTTKADYYILKAGDEKTTPQVIKIGEHGDVYIPSAKQCAEFMKFLNEKRQEEQRKQNAEEVVKTQEKQDTAEKNTNEEQVPEEPPLTPEEEEALILGNALPPIRQSSNENTDESATKEVSGTNENTGANVKNPVNNLSDTKKTTTFTEAWKQSSTRVQIQEIFKQKKWEMPKTNGQMKKFLADKQIATEGIQDINAWLQMIRDCK